MSKVKLGSLLFVLFSLLLAFHISRPGNSTGDQQNILTLQSPPLAHAEGVSSYLEEEAGISAYVQLPSTINFVYIRNLFRTIELETEDYLIGSIGVSGYDESHDVHVYVHASGWVLAYYLDSNPAGKIIDWTGYSGSTVPTKLERVITSVGNALQVTIPPIAYYDFRYPDATKMMFVIEGQYGLGSDSFQINLPSSFTYYERSWSMGNLDTNFNDGMLYLDNVLIGSINPPCCGGYWITSYGFLSEAQLLPNIFHSLKVEMIGGSCGSCETDGALVLIYEETIP